jgi:hypothetical protein
LLEFTTLQPLSTQIHKYSNVKLEEWIHCEKKNIRQDLQDYLDSGALGYLAAGEKNPLNPVNPVQKRN